MMYKIFVKLFSFSLLCFLYTNISAQCTLTYENYNSSLAVGTTYVGYVSDASTVYIGEASPNSQTWDFSSLTYEFSGTSESIDPTLAPFHSSYPSANIVIRDQVEFAGVTYDTYNYEQLTNNAVYMHAISDDYEIMLEYTPPVKSMTLPCTYGTEWELDPDTTEIMPGMYSITKYHYKADAYGTMKLPFGEFDAVRVTLNLTTITQIGVVNDTSVSQSMYFISPEFVQVNLFLSSDQIGETTLIGSEIGYTAPSNIISSIEEKEGTTPTDFELFQNYPNPFNPSTNIKFNIANAGNVKLTIYNAIGQKVDVLLNEQIQAGIYELNFDGTDYSSGNYFYELKTDNFIRIKKMILIK